jgi:hypothetical protein
MEKNPDLKTIGRRAYLSYHQDGFIDLGLGLVFLISGLLNVTGLQSLVGISWMPALLIAPMKRWITAPRMGMVKFHKSRKVILFKTAMIVLSLSVLILSVTSMFFRIQPLAGWIHRYFLLLFGASISLIPLIGAFALGIRRFYGYAALIMCGFTFAHFVKDGIHPVFIVIGSTLVLTGLVILIRFLRRYSLTERGE